MPELPEVEVTARALAHRFEGRRLDAVHIHNFNLRWRVPHNLPALVAGQRIEKVRRRGKYLLWFLPSGVLICHLGMSGSWRIHELGRVPPLGRHDHVEVHSDGAVARLNDPRRFGALLWHAHTEGDVLAHPLLAGLGVEPFGPGFDGEFLFQATRGRRTSIKQVLLAGQLVVGVGNIYATESLYAARIHPQTAGRPDRACALPTTGAGDPRDPRPRHRGRRRDPARLQQRPRRRRPIYRVCAGLWARWPALPTLRDAHPTHGAGPARDLFLPPLSTALEVPEASRCGAIYPYSRENRRQKAVLVCQQI